MEITVCSFNAGADILKDIHDKKLIFYRNPYGVYYLEIDGNIKPAYSYQECLNAFYSMGFIQLNGCIVETTNSNFSESTYILAIFSNGQIRCFSIPNNIKAPSKSTVIKEGDLYDYIINLSNNYF